MPLENYHLNYRRCVLSCPYQANENRLKFDSRIMYKTKADIKALR